MHLVRYHGLLAPSAAWRGQIVPKAPAVSYVVGEDEAERAVRRVDGGGSHGRSF